MRITEFIQAEHLAEDMHMESYEYSYDCHKILDLP